MPVPDNYKPSDTDPPSPYLRARDYTKGDKWNLTISDVNMLSFDDRTNPGRPPRNKLVLSFQGRDKGLVLNTTLRNFLEEELGKRPNAWVGAIITLVVSTAPYQGQQVPSFAIRAVNPSTSVAREPGDDDNSWP